MKLYRFIACVYYNIINLIIISYLIYNIYLIFHYLSKNGLLLSKIIKDGRRLLQYWSLLYWRRYETIWLLPTRQNHSQIPPNLLFRRPSHMSLINSTTINRNITAWSQFIIFENSGYEIKKRSSLGT